MDSSSIELPGAEIETISLQNGILNIKFSKAYIIKTMTGSNERTRWWQAGELIFTNAKVETTMLPGPLICVGGDIVDNVYTYRDMIPIPLVSRGYIRCILKFKNETQIFQSSAQTVHLKLIAVAKYIEHLRP